MIDFFSFVVFLLWGIVSFFRWVGHCIVCFCIAFFLVVVMGMFKRVLGFFRWGGIYGTYSE